MNKKLLATIVIVIVLVIAGFALAGKGELGQGKLKFGGFGKLGGKTSDSSTNLCIDNCACSGEDGVCDVEAYNKCVEGCKKKGGSKNEGKKEDEEAPEAKMSR